MVGIIDVGGGLRDIYGAGVFDRLLDDGVRFDYCLGVSAGSANLSSYIAGQRGRNYRFYADYAFRSEYMGWPHFFRSGSYLNLDYIYGTLTNADGEDPLDYPAIAASDKRFVIVAMNAGTGEPTYFTKADLKQDDYAPIKGSCCVPAVDRPYPVNGGLYFDGGMCDPIPLERAFQDGCDRVVVILTRPKEARRDPSKDRLFTRMLHRQWPKAAERLAGRAALYNRQLERAIACEAEGRVLIVSPTDIYGLGTLSKDREALLKLYEDGKRDARRIEAFLNLDHSVDKR